MVRGALATVILARALHSTALTFHHACQHATGSGDRVTFPNDSRPNKGSLVRQCCPVDGVVILRHSDDDLVFSFFLFDIVACSHDDPTLHYPPEFLWSVSAVVPLIFLLISLAGGASKLMRSMLRWTNCSAHFAPLHPDSHISVGSSLLQEQVVGGCGRVADSAGHSI